MSTGSASASSSGVADTPSTRQHGNAECASPPLLPPLLSSVTRSRSGPASQVSAPRTSSTSGRERFAARTAANRSAPPACAAMSPGVPGAVAAAPARSRTLPRVCLRSGPRTPAPAAAACRAPPEAAASPPDAGPGTLASPPRPPAPPLPPAPPRAAPPRPRRPSRRAPRRAAAAARSRARGRCPGPGRTAAAARSTPCVLANTRPARKTCRGDRRRRRCRGWIALRRAALGGRHGRLDLRRAAAE
eukprot:354176-Chlamydomonas_euryale.AAC.4